MIKFLECPDIHFSVEHQETMEKIFAKIEKTAIERQVDFIAIPGDIYDHPVMTSDRGGINALRQHIRRLTNICPVVAVYGTPSHDAPGSLEPLKDVGLVVLEMGRVYGYFVDTVKEIKGTPIPEPELILFGVPELNKKNIQAKLSVSAEQANAEAVNSFRQYVTEFVAPMRLKYSDVYAVMLMHGNMSDTSRENETNLVLRASDIVIHTEDLRAAELDRISLGHIHTPWESTVISAGYAGSWGSTWGETGFEPGMNLIELPGNIARIPYGTPERRKITQPLNYYDPNIAYWLHTDDTAATLPEDVHPWSRVTCDEVRTETRRVTKEQAEGVNSLKDLFIILDPDVSDSILDKVDTIGEKISSSSPTEIDVKLLSLCVKGCNLFHGKMVEFNLRDLGPGVIGIVGGNGEGKSSLFSFCSPYPLIVGKDEGKVLKNFFAAQDSFIEKIFLVNGKKHVHFITIRGAHTQSAKVECYLTIDGIPQLERGTFDEFFSECEARYGNFQEYLLTSFYVQPLQGKTQTGLMSASLPEIRDLVQRIAGVDREKEKRLALDIVSDLENRKIKEDSWINAAIEFQTNKDDLIRQKIIIETQAEEFKKDIAACEKKGKDIKGKLDAILAEKMKNEEEKNREKNTKSRIDLIDFEIYAKKEMIEKTREIIDGLSMATEKITLDDFARGKNREALKTADENAAKKRRYEAAAQEEIMTIRRANQEAETLHRKKRSVLELDIIKIKSEIAMLDNACPQCGYISDSAKLEECKKLLSEKSECLSVLRPPIVMPEVLSIKEPDYDTEEPLLPELPPHERQALESILSESKDASGKIIAAEEVIALLQKERLELSTLEFCVDSLIDKKASEIQVRYDELREEFVKLRELLLISTQKISGISEQIKNAEENEEKIKEAQNNLNTLIADLTDWRYISKMLQAAKIPALELEIVLDSIDCDATEILKMFCDGRYSVRSETQKIGKVGAVDKFDIIIHDNELGEDRGLTKWNPGHKSFFADAYTKALLKKRNTRQKRNYSPIIMDEADGPIQPESIKDYYNIQRDFFRDTTVLVVSHSPTSHEHIQDAVKMKEVFCGV